MPPVTTSSARASPRSDVPAISSDPLSSGLSGPSVATSRPTSGLVASRLGGCRPERPGLPKVKSPFKPQFESSERRQMTELQKSGNPPGSWFAAPAGSPPLAAPADDAAQNNEGPPTKRNCRPAFGLTPRAAVTSAVATVASNGRNQSPTRRHYRRRTCIGRRREVRRRNRPRVKSRARASGSVMPSQSARPPGHERRHGSDQSTAEPTVKTVVMPAMK